MLGQHKESQRTITATEIRRNFSAVIRRMRRRHEHTIIQSSGESVAVLLPRAEYERLMTSVLFAGSAFPRWPKSVAARGSIRTSIFLNN